MVLTGKQSLDFSGGVSAEDNFGIGGYDRVMGPNGQAQYWAPGPRRRLRRPAWRTTTTPTSRPGEAGPRRAATTDPVDRDVTRLPARAGRQRLHAPSATSSRRRPTPTARRPFDIRTVMRAVADQDHPAPRALGRDGRRRDRGRARRPPRRVSRCACSASSPSPVPRRGFPPTDGPDTYTAGHAVPAVVEEGRPGDQRRQRQPARSSCWPTCPASTAHRTRCATCSSSTAPRSAGPSSTSTARSSSSSSRATTAARSSCSPRRSTRA